MADDNGGQTPISSSYSPGLPSSTSNSPSSSTSNAPIDTSNPGSLVVITSAPSTPSSVPISSPSAAASLQAGSSGLSPGIIGAIVACICVVLIVAILVGGFLWYKLKIHGDNNGPVNHRTFSQDAPEVNALESVQKETDFVNIGGTLEPTEPSGALRYPDAEVLDSGRLERN